MNFDLKEEALDLLLPQFKDKPNIKGYISSKLEPTVELLQGINDTFDSFNIMKATGSQLDKIGKLLNTPRTESNDELYREKILHRVAINKANGTGENLISLLKLLLGDNTNFEIIEIFPAAVQVIIYEPQNIITSSLVNEILPIGVNGIFFTNPYVGKDIWTLAEVTPDGELVDDPNSIMPEVSGLDHSNLVMIDVSYVR